MQLVTFFIGNETYGLEIHEVQEVIIPDAITRVPHLPDFIDGILDIRGEVIPVIDMRKRFSTELTEAIGRVLITQISGSYVGLRVDGVGKVISVDHDKLRAAPKMLSSFGARFVSSVCDRPADQGGGIVMLVDLDKLLAESEMAALHHSDEEEEDEEDEEKMAL